MRETEENKLPPARTWARGMEVLIQGGAVFLGGACGGMARFLITLLVYGLSLPLFYSTALANVAGGFLIGRWLASAEWDALRRSSMHPTGTLYKALIGGFCGGFTTFSTFGIEALILIQADRWSAALTVGILSLGTSILAVTLGRKTVFSKKRLAR